MSKHHSQAPTGKTGIDLNGLSSICAGLGDVEEDDDGKRIGYSKGEFCLDNVKDLLRFLRRDDPETREVFMQVCKWNIVSKDLIPIIEHYQDDHNMVLNAVKILVFLTMPVDPSSNNVSQQTEYLWGLKSSITCSNTMPVIVSLLEGPLENLESDSFTENDWKLAQLVLTFFRNILSIQDISMLQKASATLFLSLRDRFLELLFHENVMDLIIVITQHIGGSHGYFRQDNLLVLEIFHYIFLGQEPELIAKPHLEPPKVGGYTNDSLDSLKSIMKDEAEKRKLVRRHNVRRHAQFSGTFTRLTMDGSKAVFKGNPSTASQSVLINPHRGHGATKKIIREYEQLPSTKINILELLHDFLNQFLSGGYNVLMQSVRGDIEKEHHGIQNSDIAIFYQVAQFVTSYQYHKLLTCKQSMDIETNQATTDQNADTSYFKGDICGPIAATINESMFSLVISRWRQAFEGLKESNDYKYLSASGSLMKTMICMLDLVLKYMPEDSKEPQTARVLLYKLFYDQTDQGITQFLLNLIKTFDTHKQSKSDLADLVETTNMIVCLMENLQKRGTLRVAKKSRRRRKKKATSDMNKPENELPRNIPTTLSETECTNLEQTRDTNMSNQETPINRYEVKENSRVSESVPEPGQCNPEMENSRDNLKSTDTKMFEVTDDNICCSSDDSLSDEQPAETNEVDFKVSTFIKSFANANVIQQLCWLLKFYKSNSNLTNHSIICMLRRITEDLELSPMLYQLSLLIIFYSILDEQKSCPCEDYTNIVDFLRSLIRKMLKKMRSQPLLFLEILFWKTRKECHYINAEYLVHELGSLKNQFRNWETVSENGEIEPSQAKGWTHRSMADALGEDEADVVISHEQGFHNEEKSERESGKVSLRKRRLVLSDDLEIQIKDLFEKFKDDSNCSRLIAEALDPDGRVSAAQVSNKLKQLGFKVAPRKKMRYSGGPSTGPEKERKGREMDDGSTLHDLERSQSKQTLNTRKGVRHFSEAQEEMIINLFEQFKDHRRCNHLIANALDADNSVTTAQVSRKLKQLGLRVPRQKTAKTDDMHFGAEESNDTPLDGAYDSDNETLVTVKSRSKRNNKNKILNELSEQQKEVKVSDESGDELLNSLRKSKLKDKRQLLSKESSEQQTEGNVSDDEILNDLSEQQKEVKVSDESGDELLNSLRKSKLKDKRQLLSKESSEQHTEGNVSDDEILNELSEQQKKVNFSDESGDELLNSLRKSKLKDKHQLLNKESSEQHTKGNISDDEILSTALKAKSHDIHKELSEQHVGGNVSDDTDDEILSSFLKDGRVEISKSSITEINKDITQDSSPKAEVSGNTPSHSPTVDIDPLLKQQLDNDLEDSEDDAMTPGTLTTTAINRRKHRMIIDFEDDD